MDVSKKVEQFIQLRDARRGLKERFEDDDKKLRVLQELLEGQLSAHLRANNVNSLRTDSGTCYTTVRYSASLQDPDAFMQFVITNKLFDLMDRRANATAVKDYIEENQIAAVPGCNLSALEHVGVRRPGKSTDA